MRGDKELDEGGRRRRREDLFELRGHVGLRQAERRKGNIGRHLCSS